MFAAQFVNLTQGMSDRQRVQAEMLLFGVAYRATGKGNWSIISLHGDYLGSMSQFILSETVRMLKNAGLKSNLNAECYRIDGQESITFCRNFILRTLSAEFIESVMERRRLAPREFV